MNSYADTPEKKIGNMILKNDEMIYFFHTVLEKEPIDPFSFIVVKKIVLRVTIGEFHAISEIILILRVITLNHVKNAI